MQTCAGIREGRAGIRATECAAVQQKILFINYYAYPGGDAGSFRVRALGRVFEHLGYAWEVLGMGKPESGTVWAFSLRAGRGRRFDRLVDHVMHGVRLRRFMRAQGDSYTHLLFSDMPFWSMVYLPKYAKKHGKILLHDSVEWYSPEQFTLGRFDYRYIAKELLNRVVVAPPTKVIAISRFLQQHFEGRGCESVRIPAILDLDEYPTDKNVSPDRIRILYAGSPGRKDSMCRVVQGYMRLTAPERERVSLYLLGIDEAQLRDLCGSMGASFFSRGIQAMGRVSHSRVIDELRHADFTILIREDEQRYARAGFPTKVVESLASATPVICNASSDLFEYLEDGKSALRVKSKHPADVTAALRRALTLDPASRALMCREARECAEQWFSPSVYVGAMEHLLESGRC